MHVTLTNKIERIQIESTPSRTHVNMIKYKLLLHFVFIGMPAVTIEKYTRY